MNDKTERAAFVMGEKADHWYWAEREICGFASDTEPPCVKSPNHHGDHDGIYRARAMERLNAWLDHQIAQNRAEMAGDAAEDAATSPDNPDLTMARIPENVHRRNEATP